MGKFRANVPPEYNVRRKLERPIPSLQCNNTNSGNSNDLGAFGNDIAEENDNDSAAVENTQQSFQHNDNQDENVVDNAEEPEHSEENVNESETEQNFFDYHDATEEIENNDELAMDVAQTSNAENTEEIENNDEQAIDVAQTSNAENTKHGLPMVRMSFRDETAIDHLFDSDSDAGAENNSPQIPPLAANEKAEVKNGKVVITKTFDRDFQMVYTFGEKLTAKYPMYNIKINDAISANIPFKENEFKDRAYIVKIGGQFKELELAVKVVNALLRLNNAENRMSVAMDKAFIKSLIIGLCGAKQIEGGEIIHKDLRIFIKGSNSNEVFKKSHILSSICLFLLISELFSIRILDLDVDGHRFLSFPKLMTEATDEVRYRKY